MNNVAAVQFFLENGVSVDQTVNSNSPVAPGYTPLHFAARYFSIETLEILINRGANKSLKDARSMSPLNLLIKRNIQIVDYLSDNEDFGENFECNKKMIKLFIDTNKSKDCNAIDDIGLSYFHAACTLQDVSLVETMFKQVLDPSHFINKDSPYWAGYTALHFAAHFDVKTFYFLVRKGADILVKDCQGVTPLDIFLQKYSDSEMNSLIDSQPQWKNIFFSDNKTKLVDLLISMQKSDKFESFLNKVSDVNMFIPHSSKLWSGYTFLHLAVALCSSAHCFTLYKDVGRPNEKIKDYTSAVQICLKYGADVTAQDIYGSTAVHVAFYKRRMDIVDQLLKKQVKVCNPVDRNGLSHLHMAYVMTKMLKNVLSMSRGIEDTEYEAALFSTQTNTNISLKSKLIAVYRVPCENPKIIYANAGSTPLHVAANAGDVELIRKLIKCGFDINCQDVEGFTPIHQLLTVQVRGSWEHQPLQKLLLSSGLKNCVSNCGLSHLHIACHLNSVEAIKKLLDSGADVNSAIVPASPTSNDEIDNINRGFRDVTSLVALMKRYASYTPLHFAIEGLGCGGSNREAIDVLLQRGANILAKKADGSVIFYAILAKRDARLMPLFIAELERNHRWQKLVEEDSGITMLHLACVAFKLDVVEQLLKSGVSANAQCHLNSPVWPGWTPLHVLMMSINREGVYSISTDKLLNNKICRMVKLLFDYGAEITIQNSQHKTPLHLSIEEITYIPLEMRNPYFTKILLKYHKDYNSNPSDERGISHFHIACICNNVASVKSFLEHGVNVDQQLDYHLKYYGGFSPLGFAILYRHEEVTRLLLQFNADVNAKNYFMETPVFDVFSLRLQFGSKVLAEKKYLDMLLSAGAKINEKNLWGTTPLQKLLDELDYETSSELVDEEIINTITKYGVCVNAFYPQGNRGFIGSILRNQKSHRNVLDNPVIQAVVNAPEVNGLDAKGRSVIHNVVSVSGKSVGNLQSEVYIKVIEKFAKLGFDIDHQDNRGSTPLHAATRFENLPAIESLLMHGADINIVDKDAEVPYACVIRYNAYGNLDNRPIHTIFYRHFSKLSSFNLDLHAKNKKMMSEARKRHNLNKSKEENQRYAALVIDENNRLKNIKIEPYSITLRDFLSETGAVAAFPFMPEPVQKCIGKFFQQKGDYLRKNFPELTGILYLQYRKALAREALIQPAALSLSVLIDFELPLLCSDAVLRFLKNEELKNLIAAKDL